MAGNHHRRRRPIVLAAALATALAAAAVVIGLGLVRSGRGSGPAKSISTQVPSAATAASGPAAVAAESRTTPTEAATTAVAATTSATTAGASGAAQFAAFILELQQRIRTTASPSAAPVPDARVTCPRVHPGLAAGDVVACDVDSATVDPAIALVHIHNVGGRDFDYVISPHWACNGLTAADQRALVTDLGSLCQ